MFCSLVKLVISNAMDSARPFPGFAERHLTQCDACRKFAGIAGALEDRLHADARGSGITIGSLLPEPVTVPSRSAVYRPLLGFAVSCVLLVFAGMTVIRMLPQETPGSPEPGRPEMTFAVPSIGDQPLLQAAAVDDLYVRELASLAHDARSAMTRVLDVFPDGVSAMAEGFIE